MRPWPWASCGWARSAWRCYALDRRTAHLVEDRFSPASGRLELHEPRGARRRMQAAAAQGWVELGGTRVAAGLLASRLRGNHVGFLDAGTGQAAAGGTGRVGHRRRRRSTGTVRSPSTGP